MGVGSKLDILGHLSVTSFRIRAAAYAKILRRLRHSDVAWAALDRARIGGFGLDLLRVDFPPDLSIPPTWGHGRELHHGLAALLEVQAEEISMTARHCLGLVSELNDLPLLPAEGAPLAWQNIFQSPLDLAFDYGMLRSRPIRCYLEIGSGTSTHLAAAARRNSEKFEIISIDPEPRADVSAVCDRVIPGCSETAVSTIVEESGPGAVLFVDGSHRSFPGSDVTRFFLDILPRLRPGTWVHLHDIYLPADYPAQFTERLWNEQYLLGAWLLGGSARLRTLLPGYWLSQRVAREGLASWAPSPPDAFVQAHQNNLSASCWWMEIE